MNTLTYIPRLKKGVINLHNTTKEPIKYMLAISLILSLSACGVRPYLTRLMHGTEYKQKAGTTDLAAGSNKPNGAEQQVSLVWKVPDSSVDGYIIELFEGVPDNLTGDDIIYNKPLKILKVPQEDLRVMQDAEHGYVYQHIIDGINKDTPVAAYLTSYVGDSRSKKVGPLEVE